MNSICCALCKLLTHKRYFGNIGTLTEEVNFWDDRGSEAVHTMSTSEKDTFKSSDGSLEATSSFCHL